VAIDDKTGHSVQEKLGHVCPLFRCSATSTYYPVW